MSELGDRIERVFQLADIVETAGSGTWAGVSLPPETQLFQLYLQAETLFQFYLRAPSPNSVNLFFGSELCIFSRN